MSSRVALSSDPRDGLHTSRFDPRGNLTYQKESATWAALMSSSNSKDGATATAAAAANNPPQLTNPVLEFSSHAYQDEGTADWCALASLLFGVFGLMLKVKKKQQQQQQ